MVQCCCSLERYAYIRTFEQIDNLSDLWAVEVKCSPDFLSFLSSRLQGHEKSGIYKITCKTCHKEYVGQTSRNLSGSTYGTLKTMALARHMHYIHLTADMIMVTLTAL